MCAHKPEINSTIIETGVCAACFFLSRIAGNEAVRVQGQVGDVYVVGTGEASKVSFRSNLGETFG